MDSGEPKCVVCNGVFCPGETPSEGNSALNSALYSIAVNLMKIGKKTVKKNRKKYGDPINWPETKVCYECIRLMTSLFVGCVTFEEAVLFLVNAHKPPPLGLSTSNATQGNLALDKAVMTDKLKECIELKAEGQEMLSNTGSEDMGHGNAGSETSREVKDGGIGNAEGTVGSSVEGLVNAVKQNQLV